MSKTLTTLKKYERFRFQPASVLLLLFLLLPVAVIAQSESGSAAVEGTVTDTNGAAVPGANITVHNLEDPFGLLKTRESFTSTRDLIKVLSSKLDLKLILPIA